MRNETKEVGLIGIGSMGGKIAEHLYRNGYSIILYNKEEDKYEPFRGREMVYTSSDLSDFASRLGQSGKQAIVWVMVPGGQVTNDLMSELGGLLHKNDIVIDASNSMYLDSIANFTKLKKKGISYLDVGCGGGPADIVDGVSLMVGGDKKAFQAAENVLKIVAGTGTYGYVGESGSGHMAKLVTNEIFYGIFPVYAEGAELLIGMAKKQPKMKFDYKEALRLMAAAPHINGEIMRTIATTINENKLPSDAPDLKVSEMVQWGAKRAVDLDVEFNITRAILERYKSISSESRRIYTAAKRIITGH